MVIGTAIYSLVAISTQWRADFQPVTHIDLSIWALPYYTLLSGCRGLVAYLFSLAFTIIIGYSAAKSKAAERVLIPMLDIGQSIPVLGFLPGLVLGLIALFPHTNVGLELAAIISIFTGQVWNMTFSFYSSLKSVPNDFQEASTVIGLNWKQKLMNVELPFSAVNLAWNSLMSMAGGWFFLSVCEAFNLGDKVYRLPGVGAYMQVAIEQGDTQAMILGVIAMVLLIVLMDFVIWRPILAWVQRFRLEDVPGVAPAEPLMKIVMRESRVIRWLKLLIRRYRFQHRPVMLQPTQSAVPTGLLRMARLQAAVQDPILSRRARAAAEKTFLVVVVMGLSIGSWHLFRVLAQVKAQTWMFLGRDTFWTLLRVVLSIILSTLWMVPIGIWIGTSSRRIRIAQPLVQVMASFPAPMLYPLALIVFFKLGIAFSWGSMFLMLLGVQWYVLFNVLAGALRVPRELKYALELMGVSRAQVWRTLYLPSVFPALVTGWVTAAGGAWNASIVAEYMSYKGQVLKTGGIGATIKTATDAGDFPTLAASLSVMVVVVVVLNRSFWAKIYHLAETRFRMDL
jgi:NitT/TauT family transport system permease protein